MASPDPNGIAASIPIPQALAPVASSAARQVAGFAGGPSALGVGLVVAIVLLAYWYRRVL